MTQSPKQESEAELATWKEQAATSAEAIVKLHAELAAAKEEIERLKATDATWLLERSERKLAAEREKARDLYSALKNMVKYGANDVTIVTGERALARYGERQ